MHRLKIILEVVTKGVQSGFKAAGSAVNRFVNGLRNMALSGARFLNSLAQSIFFVGKALGMLQDAAKAVFDRFVGGARDAAKLEVKLKSLTGSEADAARVMQYLEQVARDTGVSFEDLGGAAVLVATMAKDASGAFDIEKFERLNQMLMQMAAFTGPRVPIERLARGLAQFVTTGDVTSLEMFLDVLLDLDKAAEDATKIPGEVGKAATFITLGVGDAAKGAGKDLDWLATQLDRLGISVGLVQDMAELSGAERFAEIWAGIARIVGEPLFEELNKGLSELADWLIANPELVEEFAKALGELGAEAIKELMQAIMDFVTSGALEKLIDSFTKLIELIQSIATGDVKGVFGAVGVGVEADVGADVAAKAKTDLATLLAPWAGMADNIEIMAKAALGEVGMAAAEPQKVEVEITLDNALLDAQIVQGAEETTVRAFDEVHQNYRRQNR